jgi:hypothetical protein
MLSLMQIVISGNVGAMILGAFLTGLATLIAYELSKTEWVTLMVALVASLLSVVLGWLPSWVVFAIIIGAVIYLAYDKKGKW